MMVSAHRFRSIGWIALLLVCAALVMVLAFRVNALRSQVHRTEAKIIALRKEQMYLETEVETRANQQQLKQWNDIEFGYVAPTAGQYLSGERQLAAFAKPDAPGAPAPIRVASADDTVAAQAAFPAMVARMTGGSDADSSADHAAPAADEPAAKETTGPADHAAAAAGLGAKLATVGSGADPARKSSGEKSAKDSAKPKHDDDSAVHGKASPKIALAKTAFAKGAKPKAAPTKDAKDTKAASSGKTGKPGKTGRTGRTSP